MLYYAFLALFFTLVAATLLVDVSWGLYLAIAIYFISPWSKWWGQSLPEIRWVLIVGIINLVAFAMRYRRYSAVRLADFRPLKWLVLFTTVIVLVTPLAAWPEAHAYIIDKQLKELLFLLLAYKAIDNPAKFERLLWVYLAGMFYVGWVAHDAGRTGNGRLEGIGPVDSTDANDLGAAFVSAVPLLIFYAMEAKRLWQRGLASVFLLYVLNGLVLVNSRGAALGAAVGAGAYLGAVMLMRGRAATVRLRVFAGVFVSLMALMYLADPPFWNRQQTLATAVEDANDTADNPEYHRVTLWTYAFTLAEQHPLGIGGMGYTVVSPQFLPPEVLGTNEIKAVHSTYFEALTAYGFVGVGLFLAFLVAAFRQLGAARRALAIDDVYTRLQAYALAAAYLGYLISGIFIDRLYCEITYYFPLFFAIFANVRSCRAPAEIPIEARAGAVPLDAALCGPGLAR